MEQGLEIIIRCPRVPHHQRRLQILRAQCDRVRQGELVGPLCIADHAVGEAKVELDGRVAAVVGERGGLGRGFPEILPARCAREAMLG